MLATRNGPTAQAVFISSPVFAGKKEGYIFQLGEKGLGYYRDPFYTSSSSSSAPATTMPQPNGRKRKAGEGLTSDDEIVGLDGNGDAVDEGGDMDALLEEAGTVVQLDASSLRQLLLSFEKKITKNQKHRMKYSEEPERFMDSELELHTEIQELYAVAASPELYPIMVGAGSVVSLLGMVAHENTDISLATVGLLQEMLDSDTLREEPDKTRTFVDALVENHGLELLVQNLARLKETEADEDAQGVYNTLAIFESLVDVYSDEEADATDSSNSSSSSSSSIIDKGINIADKICTGTKLLQFLVHRLNARKFDANKLYASEVLSMLLQTSRKNRLHFSTCVFSSTSNSNTSASVETGLDLLLQAIAIYRKADVTAPDEQECVENLFQCLSSLLLEPECQETFVTAEGFELMLRCLKERQYTAGCALSALNYAVAKCRAGCERLVDIGGLKLVPPLLFEPALKSTAKKQCKRSVEEKRTLQEAVVSILAHLCSQLHDNEQPDKMYAARLVNKLTENEQEKIERCVELFMLCNAQLARTDAELADLRNSLIRRGASEEDLEDFDDEDRVNIQRLKGGLSCLQQLAIIISFACSIDVSALKKVTVLFEGVDNVMQLSLIDVLDALRGLLMSIEEGEDEEGDEKEKEDGQGKDEKSVVVLVRLAEARYKRFVVSLVLALTAKLDIDVESEGGGTDIHKSQNAADK